MKVVNCIHCGTANIVQEGARNPERCTKCGEYVELSTTLISLMPAWLIWAFDIIAILAIIVFFAYIIIQE